MKCLALTASLALIPTLSQAKTLPPEPDKGFVTEVHKTKAGSVVFAKSLAAITTPEKPGEFTNTFKSGEPVFLRAYLPMSLNNAFRAQGVNCADPFRLWFISVDGKVVKDGPADAFYAEALDPNGFKQSTSVRFDKALNGPADSDKAIWNKFNALVAPELGPGEHTVELSVRGSCEDLGESRKNVHLDAALATGTFQYIVDKNAPKVGVLPKPARKDEKLAKEAAEAIGREWGGDEILKVVFVEPEWTQRYEERLDHRKVLVGRTIAAAVAVKQTKGCKIFNVTFEQLAKGNGFGPTQRRGTGDYREVACAALK